MSRKVNPYGYRLGLPIDSNPGWKLKFYSDNRKEYSSMLNNSLKVVKLFKTDKNNGVVDVLIEANRLVFFVFVKTNNISYILKKNGGISLFVKGVKKIVGNRMSVKIHLEDVFRKTMAQSISNSITSSAKLLKQGNNYRRIARRILADNSRNREIKGISIQMSGRLGGSEISRKETFSSGSLSLSTLRNFIDYGFSEAEGIGVKVLINKGRFFDKKNFTKVDKEGKV